MNTSDGLFSQSRLQELQSLRQAGIDPYPSVCRRSHSIDEVQMNLDMLQDKAISIVGRLSCIDDHTHELVALLTDFTGSIEVVCRPDELPPDANIVLRNMAVGDFIGVSGTAVRGSDGSCFFQAQDVAMLTKSLQDLPPESELSEQRDKQQEERYIDLAVRKSSLEIFRCRTEIIRQTRDFLFKHHYIEVETSVLWPFFDISGIPQFTTIGKDGRIQYLRVCHEDRLKRLLVGGYERVFELGKSFRCESNDWKHSPEFLQLEILEAYKNYHDMMQLAEELVYSIVRNVTKGEAVVVFQGKRIDMSPPWRRLSVEDALRQYGDIDIRALDEQSTLASEMEARGLELPSGYYEWYQLVAILIDTYVEPHLMQPTILYNYPTYSNCLAKRIKEDPEYIERFEVYVTGFELANGYTLVNDPVDYIKRTQHAQHECEAWGIGIPDLDWDLVKAKSYGMPPCAIVGFGMERLMMLLTDQRSIQDVIWFPYGIPKGGDGGREVS